MEIQGERLLAVPRADVWRALNDPAVLQRCVPGCDAFEADGEDKYRVAMQATVGPVRARFTGKLLISDVVPLTSYALNFEGSGGVAGFGKGTANVFLEDAEEGTRLRYNAQAQVGGRLAQVGARLIDGVTKRMADDFFTRFTNELTAPTVGESAQTGSVSEKKSRTTPTTAVQATSITHGDRPEQQAASSPQSNHIAVLAAAVSATAAAVAVLAALFVIRFTA
ncbi:CoxG family protein [Ottowia thiooxydans]|uniref:CoxG family protein n=1 Tax=Ottowia thiooxydans TaxID=219182 RepID=UPI000402AB4A|nr:carbon monoxide dehydrogenase subunit G [Ottowia thiooxydans]